MPRLLLIAALLFAPHPIFAQQGPAVESSTTTIPANGVDVTERGTVELHVADMPLAQVLQLLSLKGQRNIITSPNVQGTVTANLYNVTFEQALQAILIPNGADFRKVGPFVYIYTRAELAAMAPPGEPARTTRIYTLNYINPTDALNYLNPMIKEGDTISASPASETGLASDHTTGGGDSHSGDNFIVVTAPSEIHAKIEGILRQIDRRPREVLIEATILRAELSDDNSLGIDFTLVGGVDLELLGATSNGIQDLALGQLPEERFERFNAIASTGFTENVQEGGLQVGIIKDHVGLFIRALEEVTDTTVLANPKVLALNRQKGQVIVGRRDGFLTTTVTETQTVQTVEFLETGTQLIFRPFIGDDGYVRMELHPEDSVGFVNANGLPTEQTTEVTTNVIVRDGQTILIGGLFREVTSETDAQIPGLGGIPLLGPLFRSKSDSTTREEVVILLTVHLVKDNEALPEASERVLQDVERLRVGSRQGLMWHGRGRVAQSHYQKALDHYERGEMDKAMWHVDMALYNHPRLSSAARLKEKISGKREWGDSELPTRTLLQRLIARERGYSLKPFGRPEPAMRLDQDMPDDTLKPEGSD